MVATGWRPYNIRRLLEAGADARFVNEEALHRKVQQTPASLISELSGNTDAVY
jgi:hypothetical protein